MNRRDFLKQLAVLPCLAFLKLPEVELPRKRIVGKGATVSFSNDDGKTWAEISTLPVYISYDFNPDNMAYLEGAFTSSKLTRTVRFLGADATTIRSVEP